MKQSRADDLLRGVRIVGAGGKFLDPAVTASVITLVGGDRERLEPDALGRREEEVLRLIAAGYTNKEVANQLGLSVKTVDTHKMRGMEKLGMTSRIDLVRFGHLQGWFDDS